MAFILAGPTQEIWRRQDEHGNRLNIYQVLYLKANTCISCRCRLHYPSSITVAKLVCRMDVNLTPKDIRKESFQCARHLLAVHCFRGYLDEVHEASQGQGSQLGGNCG